MADRSDAAKNRRARSAKRCQENKEIRRKAQREREAANTGRRQNGEPLPWDQARAARAERRRPLREQWLRQHKEDILAAS